VATDSSVARQFSGAFAEWISAGWLRIKGYRILKRNYRVRGGELDIVAERRETLVFIEVKFRRSDRFGRAEEFVDSRKQKRLRLAARTYMSSEGVNPEHKNHRFDVIAIDRFHVRHIKNAFS
jgi:putative endonuclease